MDPHTALSFFIVGITFGLAGGLSPGPITALVIGQTLRFGRLEGIKVAFTPVITDGPLLVLVMTVLSGVQALPTVMGGISAIGSLVLLHLAMDTYRAGRSGMSPDSSSAGSIKKAIATNLTNPHPYIFWFTIGGPMASKAFAITPWHLATFLGGFALGIVGSKIVMALGVHHYREFLNGRAYRWVMTTLALCLVALAVQFAWDGYQRLTS